MTKRIFPAILAIAFLTALPLDAAFARGGGGGGMGGGGGGMGGGGRGDGGGAHGGGMRGPTDRGNLSYSRPQNPSDARLFDQARKSCSGAQYPSGATPRINYDADTFSCFEPGSSRR